MLFHSLYSTIPYSTLKSSRGHSCNLLKSLTFSGVSLGLRSEKSHKLLKSLRIDENREKSTLLSFSFDFFRSTFKSQLFWDFSDFSSNLLKLLDFSLKSLFVNNITTVDFFNDFNRLRMVFFIRYIPNKRRGDYITGNRLIKSNIVTIFKRSYKKGFDKDPKKIIEYFIMDLRKIIGKLYRFIRKEVEGKSIEEIIQEINMVSKQIEELLDYNNLIHNLPIIEATVKNLAKELLDEREYKYIEELYEKIPKPLRDYTEEDIERVEGFIKGLGFILTEIYRKKVKGKEVKP